MISRIGFGRAVAGLASLVLAMAPCWAQMQPPAPTVAVSAVEEVEAVESRRFTGVLLSPGRVTLVVRVSGRIYRRILNKPDPEEEDEIDG